MHPVTQPGIYISRRRQKLHVISERLRSHSAVSLHDFRLAISESDFQNYLTRVEQSTLVAKKRRDSCPAYDELLRRGIFYYACSKQKFIKQSTRDEFKRKSQECFEEGLKRLREEARQNPVLDEGYDRDFRSGL